MNTTRNATSASFYKRCFFMVIAINLLAITLGQQGGVSDNWWKPIIKKHDLTLKSYTIHENCLIIGEKTLKNNIEFFTDVTIISNGKETYWIYKSKTATYDSKNRILEIQKCSMEKFDIKSDKTIPLSTYPRVYYLMNFEKNTTKMAFIPQDEVISK